MPHVGENECGEADSLMHRSLKCQKTGTDVFGLVRTDYKVQNLTLSDCSEIEQLRDLFGRNGGLVILGMNESGPDAPPMQRHIAHSTSVAG